MTNTELPIIEEARDSRTSRQLAGCVTLVWFLAIAALAVGGCIAKFL